MSRLCPAMLLAFLIVSAAPRASAQGPAPAVTPAAAPAPAAADVWWKPFTRPPLLLRTAGFAVMALGTLGVSGAALLLATPVPRVVDDTLGLPFPLHAPLGWSLLTLSAVVGAVGLGVLVVGMRLPAST